LFAKKVKGKPDREDGQRVVTDLEGDQLNGESGAEIGAEDQCDRLGKRHQSGAGKADQHHRGRATALNHGGNKGARRQSKKAILGKGGQDRSESGSGQSLQSIPRPLKAMERKGDTAQQAEDHQGGQSHTPFLSIIIEDLCEGECLQVRFRLTDFIANGAFHQIRYGPMWVFVLEQDGVNLLDDRHPDTVLLSQEMSGPGGLDAFGHHRHFF